LVELAKYYGITTDALLGIAETKQQNTEEEVRSAFEGLGRKEAVLKAFEVARAIVPAVYGSVSGHEDSVNDDKDVFPSENSHFYRSAIAAHEFFNFTASSENVNLSVMMLRNKANFAWLKDSEKQKKIVGLLDMLADADVLSVLYFISSTYCSESFTADYVSANTGVEAERVAEILDKLCKSGSLTGVTAHLAEGKVTVYEFYGDGIILAILSLAFEKTCGRESYEYNYNGRCKMIRG